MDKSIGVAELECDISGKTVLLRAHVAPGTAPLLMSKPTLKSLGARIDLTSGSLGLSALGVTAPLRTEASGHYQLDLSSKRQLSQSEAQIGSKTPSPENSFIISPDNLEGSDQVESSELLTLASDVR